MSPKARKTAGKRYPLNMRTTKELREQIEAAAHASGRSLVQEVEYRLEQSFQPKPLDLYTLLSSAIERAKQKYGSDSRPRILAALGEPLVGALEQLLPDLSAVQLWFFPPDGQADWDGVTKFTIYSTKRPIAER